MSSIAETVSSDGEHCFVKTCPFRSRKCVLCLNHQQKTFLCKRHRYKGCCRCHEPGTYQQDAAFRSQSPAAGHQPDRGLLIQLKGMVSQGKHDAACDLIDHHLSVLKDSSPSARLLKAQLYLEKGNVFHSMAGVPGAQEEKSQSLQKACDAFRTSVEVFETFAWGERDEQGYADALLSEANLEARLARLLGHQNLTQAKKKARTAQKILNRLECSTKATAIRVLGVIWLTLGDLPKAKQLFLAAIRAFRTSGKELESIWSAVAHWNVHLVLKDLGKNSDSVPWLKRATMIREHIEGPDAPYVKMYRESLDGLLKQLGYEKTKNQKSEAMSRGEWEAIDLALNPGH